MAKNRNTANYPECDSCGEIMKLEKIGHVRVYGGNKCRLRRFNCELCDIKKTIYANGTGDDNKVYDALEDQKNLQNQQTDYEKKFI